MALAGGALASPAPAIAVYTGAPVLDDSCAVAPPGASTAEISVGGYGFPGNFSNSQNVTFLTGGQTLGSVSSDGSAFRRVFSLPTSSNLFPARPFTVNKLPLSAQAADGSTISATTNAQDPNENFFRAGVPTAGFTRPAAAMPNRIRARSKFAVRLIGFPDPGIDSDTGTNYAGGPLYVQMRWWDAEYVFHGKPYGKKHYDEQLEYDATQPGGPVSPCIAAPPVTERGIFNHPGRFVVTFDEGPYSDPYDKRQRKPSPTLAKLVLRVTR